MPLLVITIYSSLFIWVLLLIRALYVKSYKPVLFFGILLMLFLNVGYFFNGTSASIASFVAIYDVLINIGLSSDETANAVTKCADNACSAWGDRYVNHPAWGAAFHDRFANGPEFRSTLLYGHILFNSIAFILMHFQLFWSGYGVNKSKHRIIGYVSFVSVTISVVCAVWLSSQHGSVEEYGGVLAEYGFYSMSAFVYVCMLMGIFMARSGDMVKHRVWMFRFVGSMWGSFWLFRIILFIIDPLLRQYEAAAILTVIWGSAPMGILIAEIIRRRIDRPIIHGETIQA